MSKPLDAYAVIGVVTPGAIVILGASIAFQQISRYTIDEGVTLGGLGIFVILSFAAGHLIQAIGNLLETVFWKPFGGKPSLWVLGAKQTLLSDGQRTRLFDKAKSIDDGFTPEGNHAAEAWTAITREIYARVKSAKAAGRVDAFNRNYGMLRGIAAAMIVSSVIIAQKKGIDWDLVAVSVFTVLVALFRMYVFGKHYARELFVSFLSLK